MNFTLVILVVSLLGAGCAHEAKQADSTGEHSIGAKRKPTGDSTAPVCTQWTDAATPAQQQIINDMMATREHRLKHAFWHAVRGGLTQKDQSTLLVSFGPSWSQFHQLCPAPTDQLKENPAGEDFLYMHREMLQMLRSSFIEANQPCITGWKTSAEWPGPPGRTRADAKSPETLALLQKWDAHFQDPAWLRSHSLSQLGWALEYSVHNNLHMRFATDLPPKGFDADGAPLTLDGHFPANWIYDNPKYNWLADPYSAAVNPTFWKIHGYVDSMIDGWLAANHFDRIDDDCANDSKCYQWKGHWTGDLTPPKSFPDRVRRASAPPTQDEIRELTRRRLDIQRRGALKDSDFHRVFKSGSKASVGDGATVGAGENSGPSDDPFEYTRASLCQ